MRFYHVVENAQRDGRPVYVLVKTYRRWGNLMKWLMRPECKPSWVVESRNEWLPVNGQESQPTVGGNMTQYWNIGSGWNRAIMPKLPLADK